MTLEQYRYPHLYQLQKEGDRYANIELLRHFSLSRLGRGANRRLAHDPGFTFELHEHHRQELNAKWWVVRVEHRGEQPQVLEHEAPDRGMTYAAKAWPSRKRRASCPPRITPGSPRHRRADGHRDRSRGRGDLPGPVRPGKGAVPLGQAGRTGREYTTCWIRVSQGWAGGQYGTMAIPRIGHEVIVSFHEGDPDRPLITGRVYNSANPVPYPLPENKTRTVFKSMSTPGSAQKRGFNELRIEDKKGQEEIYAHAEKDVNVHVKNDWKEHILHDQHRTIDNFSYSLVKGEDQQTVEKDRKVELLSDDHLTVRGSSHSSFGDKWLLRTGNESTSRPEAKRSSKPARN
jgi:type VI secretion system secreted protein VgrG